MNSIRSLTVVLLIAVCQTMGCGDSSSTPVAGVVPPGWVQVDVPNSAVQISFPQQPTFDASAEEYVCQYHNDGKYTILSISVTRGVDSSKPLESVMRDSQATANIVDTKYTEISLGPHEGLEASSRGISGGGKELFEWVRLYYIEDEFYYINCLANDRAEGERLKDKFFKSIGLAN